MSPQDDGRVENLRLVKEAPPVPQVTLDNDGWWTRYRRSIARLSSDTCAVVEEDAKWIADRAVPSNSDGIDISQWPSDRVRTGVVVGSVQSGKTASMLAVAALALDRGIDILVVLSGTRVALWLQTYERLLAQLDGTNVSTAWQRGSARVIVPEPHDVIGGEERASPNRYLEYSRPTVKKAIQQQRPIIFVVPKEDDHLLALSRFLSQVPPHEELDRRRRPLTMLVLDDEADDASILDAKDGTKVTPQLISMLWTGRSDSTATRHPMVYATYVAYTATPQANYLQATHNPLSPRHFHAALRVPADRGKLRPRALTFEEKHGLRNYYCGGDFFYERLRDLPGDLCIPYRFPTPNPNETVDAYDRRFRDHKWAMIGDALRSYFVASAVRLLNSGRHLSTLKCEPAPLEELLSALPAPSTMLYHPSALREWQFEGAEDIVRWSTSLAGAEEEAQLEIDDAENILLKLDSAGLERRLNDEEQRWRDWLPRFQESATSLAMVPGASFPATSSLRWEAVRAALITDIFPHTQLRVLNSDPRADDRPSFGPIESEIKGAYFPPRDINTIFVAGNVLSRGLTVEGLCTSLFLRSSKEPAADTQMQMQRWFGYRGSYLHLCRVLLFDDQLAQFRAYHNNDKALKQEIVSHMESGDAPFSDGVLVLQGETFIATGKVDTRRIPLFPGPSPTVRLVERAEDGQDASNAELLVNALESGTWSDVFQPAGTLRGRIREKPISLLEAATLLEEFRYRTHNPPLADELSQRWVHLRQLLRIPHALFRPPPGGPQRSTLDPDECPYSIAAYLRLWHSVLDIHEAPGLYPTDAPRSPWSLIDIAEYRRQRPVFYVGVRYGSAGLAKGRLGELGVMTMKRSMSTTRADFLATLWGTRGLGDTYVGDQLFDYCFHGTTPVPRLHGDSLWRPRGHPGMILFHVVRHSASDTPTNDAVAVGLALPHGGPDHIAALRG